MPNVLGRVAVRNRRSGRRSAMLDTLTKARGTMTWHPAAWQQCTNRRDNLASQVESGGRSTTARLTQ